MKTVVPNVVVVWSSLVGSTNCFSVPKPPLTAPNPNRRSLLGQFVGAATLLAPTLLAPTLSQAAEFTPGGSLVDRAVGVTVGNAEASASRKFDNSNVLFDKDFYFKFGTASAWIEPDSTEFPVSMPFTKSQQRYDALKKYQERVSTGVQTIQSLQNAQDVADPTATDVYYLRPIGLLANGMLASENTGAPNELFLARYYINEMYLLITDLKQATDPSQRQKIYSILTKAVNSYLTLMNRVITPKVGEKFQYI